MKSMKPRTVEMPTRLKTDLVATLRTTPEAIHSDAGWIDRCECGTVRHVSALGVVGTLLVKAKAARWETDKSTVYLSPYEPSEGADDEDTELCNFACAFYDHDPLGVLFTDRENAPVMFSDLEPECHLTLSQIADCVQHFL